MECAWLICPNINKWGQNCHSHRVNSVFYCEERSIMTSRKDRTNADRSENSNRTIQIYSDQEWPPTAFVLTGFGVLLRVRVCYLQWVDWPIVIRNLVWIPCNLRLTWLNTQLFTMQWNLHRGCRNIWKYPATKLSENGVSLLDTIRRNTYQMTPLWNFLLSTHKHSHAVGI